MAWKDIKERMKKAAPRAGWFIDAVDMGVDIWNVVSEWQILKSLKEMKAPTQAVVNSVTNATTDAAKSTIEKRRTKREFGQAFAKLNNPDRRAIMELLKRLRRMDARAPKNRPTHYLENFIINASLYGSTVEDTTELLRTLAKYTTAEACQLIDDFDLEKNPTHHLHNMRRQFVALRRWMARTDKSAAAAVRRTRNQIRRWQRQQVANNFGIPQRQQINIPGLRWLARVVFPR